MVVVVVLVVVEEVVVAAVTAVMLIGDVMVGKISFVHSIKELWSGAQQ
jgi:hypothetical protein